MATQHIDMKQKFLFLEKMSFYGHIFSRVHATLYVTMSVRRSVGPSVRPKSLRTRLKAIGLVHLRSAPELNATVLSFAHVAYICLVAEDTFFWQNVALYLIVASASSCRWTGNAWFVDIH